jgi:hypothetical protein
VALLLLLLLLLLPPGSSPINWAPILPLLFFPLQNRE